MTERIRQALEADRLYLNPTPTLAELAAHTGLAPRLISFTINAGMGQSFNDLVNGLRVAEVQRRLAASAAHRFMLLGIAFESGFNSKTAFNRISEAGLLRYSQRLSAGFPAQGWSALGKPD